ncbi:hypothetical protein GCM10010140_71950 [Streptosporangium pseudovulgare]|uniref:Tn3 transposase DDE domain-containing protein n=1 Tax=Streptosporangium pseudovulgare TaxID=35765 RepID=A0ABQ2RKP9_9ACTN|nr:hypothetical protein GCM10010140_71950 [Streptosporangium pseudovulgare]
MFKEDTRGRRRVVRVVFEVVTFQALREQLRCKEIWVASAGRWRDPDEDLPRDFEARRAEHYGELRKPLNPREFVDQLREEMTAELMVLDEEIGGLDWVDITERKTGAIRFSAPGPQEEPRNLRKVKAGVGRRWQAVPLIDILKEAILRTGCLHKVAALSGGGTLDAQVLAERLMLAIYAYGMNTGIRQVIGVDSGHSEEEVRYARRRYLTLDAARLIATEIANATFAARDAGLWGQSSTAVASDSTHFRSWDQNLFTEWHSRYGGRGILVYWHVELGSVVVHCQTLKASASEVAAMVEGAIRHGTTMRLEGNYVDSHGQSEIGFGITRLLNIELLPRIKQINHVRLYRPVAGDADRFPNLRAAMTRPIRWDVIENNYDQGHQVRHRDPHRQRLHRGDPFPLHPRGLSPRLPGHAGDRPRPAHPVRRPLPARSGPAARDRGGPERGGGVEPRQRGDLLRQGRGDLHEQPGGGRDGRHVPAHPPGIDRLPEHPDAPGRPGGAPLVRGARPRRPPRLDPALLESHSPLR